MPDLGFELRPLGSGDCTDCSPEVSLPKGRPGLLCSPRCPDAWHSARGRQSGGSTQHLQGEGKKGRREGKSPKRMAFLSFFSHSLIEGICLRVSWKLLEIVRRGNTAVRFRDGHRARTWRVSGNHAGITPGKLADQGLYCEPYSLYCEALKCQNLYISLQIIKTLEA